MPNNNKVATTAGKTIIKNYKVSLSYVQNFVDENAMSAEQIVTKEVELRMLSRAKSEDTHFAVQFLASADKQGFDEIAPIAVRFAELAIVDEKQRNSIIHDEMACYDLFFKAEVQDDLQRFLAGWGVWKQMLKQVAE